MRGSLEDISRPIPANYPDKMLHKKNPPPREAIKIAACTLVEAGKPAVMLVFPIRIAVR